MVVRVHDRDVDHVGRELWRPELDNGDDEPLPALGARQVTDEVVGRTSIGTLPPATFPRLFSHTEGCRYQRARLQFCERRGYPSPTTRCCYACFATSLNLDATEPRIPSQSG